MATIKNLELKVVRGKTKNRAKISLKFDVSFTQAERTHRLKFGMYAGIYEIDYAEDSSILPIPNGYESLSLINLNSVNNKPGNSEDDFITWLTPQVINPNGRTKMNYQLESEILVKNRNASNETFKAFVYVVPEIFAGFGWSEKATIPKEIANGTSSDVKQEPVKDVKDVKITEQKTPTQEIKPKPVVRSKIIKKAAPKIVKQAQPKA